jgi:hypothetical protein
MVRLQQYLSATLKPRSERVVLHAVPHEIGQNPMKAENIIKLDTHSQNELSTPVAELVHMCELILLISREPNRTTPREQSVDLL